jgi:diaminohydroxyphosphoribosylaminopyrimidine deaminase/5-amino-6-(5-phosphoribosylamino)uracil reductase
MSNEALMRRAIALSRRGYPAPNPHVGCVIARSGRIVGEGYCHHAGGDHAEVMALKQAGADAKGADVFVTLEPCNHYGRTPPCSLAVDAGVRSVTAACLDPNPKAAGGLETLRKKGIEICVGMLESEARAANPMFLTAVDRGTPYVVLKSAMSLDGRAALPNGESRWITGEESRRAGHRLRADCGAVLVGVGTVLCDDPVLSARVPGVVNQPLRVVLDPDSRLSGAEAVFGPGQPTLHVVRDATHEGQFAIPCGPGGFDLVELMRELRARNVIGLLVEGGPRTASAFLEAHLVDRLELFIAPKVLGAGPAWVEGGVEQLTQAYGFSIVSARRSGRDLHIVAYPI